MPKSNHSPKGFHPPVGLPTWQPLISTLGSRRGIRIPAITRGNQHARAKGDENDALSSRTERAG